MADKWIPLPRIEGKASRQAHTDLPEGTYEREFGKEGFLARRRSSTTAIRRPAGSTGRARSGPAPSIPP